MITMDKDSAVKSVKDEMEEKLNQTLRLVTQFIKLASFIELD